MPKRITLDPPTRSDALEPPAPPALPPAGRPQPPAKKPPRKPRPARQPWLGRFARWAFRWSLTAAIWGFIVGLGAVAYYAYDLPTVGDVLAIKRRPALTILAADGSQLGSFGDVYGEAVRVQDLPPQVPQAVMAIEDRRFYDHFGVDVLGLARAAYANARAKRVVQGGSTITQQVAKNLFLAPDRTFKRKIQEVLLALWLEGRFTKDQIFTIYLNRVYLGSGVYGIDAAARRYFGKPARQLGTYEAAMIAGLLKAPSRYNPLNDPQAAVDRTRMVLEAMAEAGFIPSADVPPTAAAEKVLAEGGGDRSGRYFVDWVVEQVPDFAMPGDRDLVIWTTVYPRLQQAAEADIAAALDKEGTALNIGQAALVAMAPDGAVRAMVGGRDYDKSQFNRATQAQRQPGSAFKPFVYLAALEAGLTPDTIMLDAPVTVDGWSPRNFNNHYSGEIPLRRALAESSNAVTVRVAERIGRANVARTARRFGLAENALVTPSLALGAAETTLVELTGAYAAIANGGTGVIPYAVFEIRDAQGYVLYKRSGGGPGRIAKASTIGTLVQMMSEVMRSGTGKAAALDRRAAGKTGTSQEFRDAWFVGFTADIVAGVWMGNDNGDPMNKVTGGGPPARIWRAFMEKANGGLPKSPLPGDDQPLLSQQVPQQRPSAPKQDLSPSWLDSLLRMFGG